METLYQNLIKINNKNLKGITIDISSIYNLDFNIPSIQRLEYKDKITEIVKYQEEYFKKINVLIFRSNKYTSLFI